MTTCPNCKKMFYEDAGEMADPRDICSCSRAEIAAASQRRRSIWTEIRELWEKYHGPANDDWKLLLSLTFQKYGYVLDEMSGPEILERLQVMEEIRVINEHWAERFCVAAIEYCNSVQEAGKLIDHLQFHAAGNQQFDGLMKLVQARMSNMNESYFYRHERY